MLRLLTATILILSATPVFAQVVPATPGTITNPVTKFQTGPFGYQYDLSGRSTNTYDYGNGMTGYTSKDSQGRITSQGTIYEPFRSAPPAMPYPNLSPPGYPQPSTR